MKEKFLDDAYFNRLNAAARAAKNRRKVVILVMATFLGAGICSGGAFLPDDGTGNCGGCHSRATFAPVETESGSYPRKAPANINGSSGCDSIGGSNSRSSR
ncbi:hypothetical protein [Geobacter sp. DSM 9736]|uniref:hypothetical protein n=1 Tax=Geobacter sp. DSM 9736 TaxID=1277350 RepID=UPI000B5027CC|nr:hypothetical protein [Geobacter sp. DSM 9736]SNB47136.1 hypothetical protein SAMN06269301_2612 [Geobacter sp. DSM 9736]